MKAISLEVFRNSLGDCSNGGISSRYSEVLIECKDGYIEIDENNLPENFCKVVERDLGFETYLHIEPYNSPDKGCIGWMAGGCFCSTSDSRFSRISKYPLALHDRQETQELYDRMSDEKGANKMKYYTIMHGITGDYKQGYKGAKEANAAAKYIRGFGYEVDIIKVSERKQGK